MVPAEGVLTQKQGVAGKAILLRRRNIRINRYKFVRSARWLTFANNKIYHPMAKTRLTPFARLFLFLLVLLPAAYFGSSYYNGEDPVAKIKDYLGVEQTSVVTEVAPPASATDSAPAAAPATFENVQDLRAEMKNLKAELAIAQERLARCQAENVE